MATTPPRLTVVTSPGGNDPASPISPDLGLGDLDLLSCEELRKKVKHYAMRELELVTELERLRARLAKQAFALSSAQSSASLQSPPMDASRALSIKLTHSTSGMSVGNSPSMSSDPSPRYLQSQNLLTECEAEIAKLQDEIEVSEARNQELIQFEEGFEEQIAKQKDLLKVWQAQLAQCQKAVAVERRQRDTIKRTLALQKETLRNEERVFEQKQEYWEKKRREWESTLSKLSSEYAHAQASGMRDVDQLDKELRRIQLERRNSCVMRTSSMDREASELEKLKSQVDRMEAENAGLHEQLEEAREEGKALRDTVQELERGSTLDQAIIGSLRDMAKRKLDSVAGSVVGSVAGGSPQVDGGSLRGASASPVAPPAPPQPRQPSPTRCTSPRYTNLMKEYLALELANKAMTAELTALKEDFAALKTQADKDRSAATAIAADRAEVERLVEAEAEHERLMRDLEPELVRLENMETEYENYKKDQAVEMKTLRDEVAHLSAANADTTRQKEQLQGCRNALKLCQEAAARDIMRVKKSLDDSRERLSRCENERDALAAQVETLRGERDSAREEAAKPMSPTSADVDAMQRELDTLRQQRAVDEILLTQFRGEFEKQGEKVRHLMLETEEIESFEQEIAGLTRKLNEVEVENQKLQHLVEDGEATINMLKVKIDAQKRDIKLLDAAAGWRRTKDGAPCPGTGDSASGAPDVDAEEDIAVLREQIKTLRARHVDATALNEQLLQSAVAANNELAEVSGNLKLARVETRAATEKVDALTKKLEQRAPPTPRTPRTLEQESRKVRDLERLLDDRSSALQDAETTIQRLEDEVLSLRGHLRQSENRALKGGSSLKLTEENLNSLQELESANQKIRALEEVVQQQQLKNAALAVAVEKTQKAKGVGVAAPASAAADTAVAASERSASAPAGENAAADASASASAEQRGDAQAPGDDGAGEGVGDSDPPAAGGVAAAPEASALLLEKESALEEANETIRSLQTQLDAALRAQRAEQPRQSSGGPPPKRANSADVAALTQSATAVCAAAAAGGDARENTLTSLPTTLDGGAMQSSMVTVVAVTRVGGAPAANTSMGAVPDNIAAMSTPSRPVPAVPTISGTTAGGATTMEDEAVRTPPLTVAEGSPAATPSIGVAVVIEDSMDMVGVTRAETTGAELEAAAAVAVAAAREEASPSIQLSDTAQAPMVGMRPQSASPAVVSAETPSPSPSPRPGGRDNNNNSTTTPLADDEAQTDRQIEVLTERLLEETRKAAALDKELQQLKDVVELNAHERDVLAELLHRQLHEGSLEGGPAVATDSGGSVVATTAVHGHATPPRTSLGSAVDAADASQLRGEYRVLTAAHMHLKARYTELQERYEEAQAALAKGAGRAAGGGTETPVHSSPRGVPNLDLSPNGLLAKIRHLKERVDELEEEKAVGGGGDVPEAAASSSSMPGLHLSRNSGGGATASASANSARGGKNLEVHAQELELHIVELEMSNETLRQTVQQLRQQLEELQQTAAAAAVALPRANTIGDASEGNLTSTDDPEREKLEIDNARLDLENEALKLSVQQLRKKLSVATSQHTPESSALEVTAGRVKTLEAEMAALTHEKQEYEAQAAQVELENDALKLSVKQLKKRVAQLKEQLEPRGGGGVDVAALASQLEAATAARDQFETQATQLDLENEALKLSVQQLKRKVAALSEAASPALSAAETQPCEGNTVSPSVDGQAREHTEALKAEVEKLTGERDNFEMQTSRLDLENEALRVSVQQLRKKLAAAEAAATPPAADGDAAAAGKLAGLEADVAKLEGERDAIELEASRLDLENDALKLSVQQLKKKVAALEAAAEAAAAEAQQDASATTASDPFASIPQMSMGGSAGEAADDKQVLARSEHGMPRRRSETMIHLETEDASQENELTASLKAEGDDTAAVREGHAKELEAMAARLASAEAAHAGAMQEAAMLRRRVAELETPNAGIPDPAGLKEVVDTLRAGNQEERNALDSAVRELKSKVARLGDASPEVAARGRDRERGGSVPPSPSPLVGPGGPGGAAGVGCTTPARTGGAGRTATPATAYTTGTTTTSGGLLDLSQATSPGGPGASPSPRGGGAVAAVSERDALIARVERVESERAVLLQTVEELKRKVAQQRGGSASPVGRSPSPSAVVSQHQRTLHELEAGLKRAERGKLDAEMYLVQVEVERDTLRTSQVSLEKQLRHAEEVAAGAQQLAHERQEALAQLEILYHELQRTQEEHEANVHSLNELHEENAALHARLEQTEDAVITFHAREEASSPARLAPRVEQLEQKLTLVENEKQQRDTQLAKVELERDALQVSLNLARQMQQESSKGLSGTQETLQKQLAQLTAAHDTLAAKAASLEAAAQQTALERDALELVETQLKKRVCEYEEHIKQLTGEVEAAMALSKRMGELETEVQTLQASSFELQKDADGKGRELERVSNELARALTGQEEAVEEAAILQASLITQEKESDEEIALIKQLAEEMEAGLKAEVARLAEEAKEGEQRGKVADEALAEVGRMEGELAKERDDAKKNQQMAEEIITECEKECAGLRDSLRDIAEQRDLAQQNLNAHIKASSTHHDDLRHSLLTAEKRLSAIEGERDRLQETVDTLRAECAETDKARDRLAVELRDETERVDTLEANLKQLTERYTARCDELTKQLAAAAKEEAVLNEKLATQNTRLTAEEEKVAVCAAAREESQTALAASKQRCTGLERDLSEALAHGAACDERIVVLKQEAEEQHARFDATLATQQELRGTLQLNHEKCRRLEEEVVALKLAVDAAEQRCAVLTLDVDSERTKHEASLVVQRDLRDHVKLIEERCTTLTGERNAARESLRQAEQRANIAALEEEAARAKTESSLQVEVMQLRKDRLAFEGTCMAAQKELEEVTTERDTLKAQNTQLAGDRAALADREEVLRRTNEEFETKVKALDSLVVQIQTSRTEAEAERDGLHCELEARTAEVALLRSQLADAAAAADADANADAPLPVTAAPAESSPSVIAAAFAPRSGSASPSYALSARRRRVDYAVDPTPVPAAHTRTAAHSPHMLPIPGGGAFRGDEEVAGAAAGRAPSPRLHTPQPMAATPPPGTAAFGSGVGHTEKRAPLTTPPVGSRAAEIKEIAANGDRSMSPPMPLVSRLGSKRQEWEMKHVEFEDNVTLLKVQLEGLSEAMKRSTAAAQHLSDKWSAAPSPTAAGGAGAAGSLSRERSSGGLAAAGAYRESIDRELPAARVASVTPRTNVPSTSPMRNQYRSPAFSPPIRQPLP